MVDNEISSWSLSKAFLMLQHPVRTSLLGGHLIDIYLRHRSIYIGVFAYIPHQRLSDISRITGLDFFNV